MPFSLGEKRTLDCQYGTKYYKSKPHSSDRVFLQGTRKKACQAQRINRNRSASPPHKNNCVWIHLCKLQHFFTSRTTEIQPQSEHVGILSIHGCKWSLGDRNWDTRCCYPVASTHIHLYFHWKAWFLQMGKVFTLITSQPGCVWLCSLYSQACSSS